MWNARNLFLCFGLLGCLSCSKSGGGGGFPPQAGEQPAPLPPNSQPPDPLPPSLPSPSSLTEKIVHTGAFAPGKTSVALEGSSIKFRFEGDETLEYQVQLDDPGVQAGLLRVYEATSDSYPLWEGGPAFRTADGAVHLPSWLANVSQLVSSSVQGNTLTVEYLDSIEGEHRRLHHFELLGKTLRIRVESLNKDDLSFASNYAGLYTGRTSQTENPKIIQMMGNLATPLVLFQNGSEKFFFANQLDLYASNASDWNLTPPKSVAPGPDWIHFAYDTVGLYKQNTAGSLSATLDDSISIVVSKRIKDALVTPTQAPSPYRNLLAERSAVLLAGDKTSWLQYIEHMSQFHLWGMDQIAVYAFDWWSASQPDPLQNLGPDWHPAVADEGLFSAMGQYNAKQGMLLGLYSYFGVAPISSPLFDPDEIARDSSGNEKTNMIDYPVPFPSMAETASIAHVQREAPLWKSHYGANCSYVDISLATAPTDKISGDHIDQRADSPWAKTLRQACLDRKLWLRLLQETMQGPVMGEGSIAHYHSNMEWLWAGYCDGVQRSINSDYQNFPSLLPADSPVAPTNWQVIPEFELRVMARLQAHQGNGLYDRFFTAADASLFANGELLKAPFPTAALDRYRIYELTYGHTAFFTTNGPKIDQVVSHDQMVKGHHLLNALQSEALRSPIQEIAYEKDGEMKSFEAILFETGTTDSFRDPRIRLIYQNGLILWLNHGKTAWEVDAGGKHYLVPEDGFVGIHPPTGLIAFSAIPPETSGNRIDYVFAPGRYELLDGRMKIKQYGGISHGLFFPLESFRMKLHTTGRTVYGFGGTVGVIEGVAPALQSIEIEFPVEQIAIGDWIPVRATAHFDNASWESVTTRMEWKSSNPEVGAVDQGGGFKALATGTTEISGAYLGLAAKPTLIKVQ